MTTAAVSPAPAPAAPALPSRRWDLVGRSLMGLNSAVTFAVFINGLFLMADAADDRMMVEGWRTFGYLVFAAMWAMLAYRPRQVPAIWEMVIFHKVAATVLAFTILDTTEGFQSSFTDTSVAALTIFSYVACRGWQSWRVLRQDSATTVPQHS